MKVVDLKTMVAQNEEPYIGGRYFLFLELITDEGITGLGERIAGSSYSNHLGDLKSQVSLIQEANQGPLHKTIFKEPLIFENGYIIPPTGPGLGIEFDKNVLKKHLVK